MPVTQPERLDGPTFICSDCRAAVFDALGEVRERCHPCQWVANIHDPKERAEIRAWLIEVGAIAGPEERT
jgi:hypothetical protein